MKTATIKEIFSSIQGEGLYIGEKQLFIRFCGCNLKCNYCDTDFANNEKFIFYDTNTSFDNPISAENLANIVNSVDAQTVSLTGGEPLLHWDFLLEFLPLVKNKKIYLETNGTLPHELKQVVKYIDVVSMDIKLFCSTEQDNKFDENREFIKIANDNNKEIFAKIVLDKNYSKEELLQAIEILREFNTPLIIQPMDCKDKTQELNKAEMMELFEFVYQNYKNLRLIPQVHKFLDLL